MTPSELITPGDTDDLAPDRLVAHREYVALAAIAHDDDLPSANEALMALAACCQEGDAFRWLWAIMKSTDHTRWDDVIESLPDDIPVHPDIHDAVSRFVVLGEGNSGSDGGRVALLRSCVHRTGIEMARQIADGDDDVEGELLNAALEVLGASRVSKDRSQAFSLIDQMDDEDQLNGLPAICPPFLSGEQSRIAAIVTRAVGSVPGGTTTSQTNVAIVLNRFKSKTIQAVLEDAAWQGGDRQGVLAHMLLRTPKIANTLLARGLDPGVATDIFAAATGELSVVDLAGIAQHHHGTYPSPVLAQARSQVRTSIQADGPDRKTLLMTYWSFVGSAQDPRPADELATFLVAGELGSAAALNRGTTNWRHVGRAAGLVAEQDRATFVAEAETIADALKSSPKAHTAFIDGFTDAAPSHREFSESIQRHYVLAIDDVSSLLAAGRLDTAVSGAAALRSIDGSSRAAVDILSSGREDLKADDVEKLCELVSWSDESDYKRYVAHLTSWPDRLAGEVRRATESFTDVVARRIPPHLMKLLLSSAIDSGFKEAPTNHDALSELLHHRNADLVAEVARWIQVSGDTSELTVEAVNQADRDTDHGNSSVVELRIALAGGLTRQAAETASPIGDRVAALGLAARTDQDHARRAAFNLADTDDTQIRDAAADVLINTTAQVGDDKKLTDLIAKESVGKIKTKLERSLRAVKTGNVGEALHALLVMLDLLDDVASADAHVLLPDETWHKGFINEVNDLLDGDRTPDSPRAFLNVACSLADTLAEQALLARFDSNPSDVKLKPEQARAIRGNKRGKPDIGVLLRNPQNQSRFPWFHQLLSLKQYRQAHTAPTGSTEPLALGQREHLKTKNYLEDVVSGWIASMNETDAMK